jgi:hypothetical protein
MKTLRSRAWILGSVFVPAGALLLFADLPGCGGSETNNGPPGDGSSDAVSTPDSPNENEAASDSSPPISDSSPPNEATTPVDGGVDALPGEADAEAGTAEASVSDASHVDSGGEDASDSAAEKPETSVSESGTGDSAVNDAEVVDSTVSGGDGGTPEAGPTEAGVDASDGAVFCAPGIPQPTAANFITAMATTVCQAQQACCGLTDDQFNMPLCLEIRENEDIYVSQLYVGWLGLPPAAPFISGGNIAYNVTNACSCLIGNETLNCGANAATDLNTLQQTCFGAIPGTVALGGACSSSYECTQEAYCTVNSGTELDAGLGTCTALVGNGGACTNGYECSSLLTGSPSLYCDSTSGTCAPRFGTGVACTYDFQCASQVCQGSTCQAGEVFSDPLGSGGVCDAFTLPDSGAGGH